MRSVSPITNTRLVITRAIFNRTTVSYWRDPLHCSRPNETGWPAPLAVPPRSFRHCGRRRSGWNRRRRCRSWSWPGSRESFGQQGIEVGVGPVARSEAHLQGAWSADATSRSRARGSLTSSGRPWTGPWRVMQTVEVGTGCPLSEPSSTRRIAQRCGGLQPDRLRGAGSAHHHGNP